MTKEELIKLLGLRKEQFEPHNNEEDTEEALCELADMISSLEDAVVELAGLIQNTEG